jgi:ATP-dependent Lon protease
LIPVENERDLEEIPKNIKDQLEIKPVKWIDEVLQVALQQMPEARVAVKVSATDDKLVPAKKKRAKQERVRHH